MAQIFKTKQEEDLFNTRLRDFVSEFGTQHLTLRFPKHWLNEPGMKCESVAGVKALYDTINTIVLQVDYENSQVYHIATSNY